MMNNSWRPLRLRLTLIYIVVAIGLLIISIVGQLRLIDQIDKVLWLQNYGLALLAGMCWLVVGLCLLLASTDWAGAVEGMTLLPPSMLLLLYYWSNVQSTNRADALSQLLWVSSIALLGAAFIHLNLTYQREALTMSRSARILDALPYFPFILLVAYEWGGYFLPGTVSTSINLVLSLGYAAVGGLIGLGIGIKSLLLIGRRRSRIGDILKLWIGGIGLGFCLGVLPILLTGHMFLPLPIFFVLATIFPLILIYEIRTWRLIDRLQITLEQSEVALGEQRRTGEELCRNNSELQSAASLLLHADAHLRAVLSQRIHDQPKQQALRIRSLLAHWQHKLRVESELKPEGKVAVQPIIEMLSRVRKISEELEGDLRGLQLLVEDANQRRSLGLKLHLEKLIREDLPALHPESPLKVQADLWALDTISSNLEQTEEGEKIAEAISYATTQALLNIYNHAGANFATVRTIVTNGSLDVYIVDDGKGFDAHHISPKKTSLFKAQLKAREAGGSLVIKSVPRPQAEHGTTVILHLPLLPDMRRSLSGPLPL